MHKLTQGFFICALSMAVVGCDSGSSSNKNTAPVAPAVNPMDVKYADLTQKQIQRECSNSEFSKLVKWRNLLNTADTEIQQVKRTASQKTIADSQKAIQACYEMIEMVQNSCRKTNKTILGVEIKTYSQKRIQNDCTNVNNYLVKHNARLEPGQTIAQTSPSTPANPPQVSQPTTPNKPPVATPVLPPVAVPSNPTTSVPSTSSSSGLRQCSAAEFQTLSSWSTLVSQSEKAINSMGSPSQWSYAANAISLAAQATKSCETLMKTYSSDSCEKGIKQADGSVSYKQYSRQNIAQRCETSRTYFYEYVQNSKTLIFQNADLYLDLSTLKHTSFPAGFVELVQGCRIENPTKNTISYSSQFALLTDTRGFEAKMVVFETVEGLQLACYGLDINGTFSKRQIVKILKEAGSDIRLQYKLK